MKCRFNHKILTLVVTFLLWIGIVPLEAYRRFSANLISRSMLRMKGSKIISEPDSPKSFLSRYLKEYARLIPAAAALAVGSSGHLQRATAAESKLVTSSLVLPECADSIVVLQNREGREVVLIGTAHISEDSAEQVRRVIRKVMPQVVMVELDRKRVGKVDDERTWNEMGFDIPPDQQSIVASASVMSSDNPRSSSIGMQSTQPPASIGLPTPVEKPSFLQSMGSFVARQVQSATQVVVGAVLGKVLSQFYDSLEKLGFTAGGEFKAAIEEARSVGARVLLGDRDVDVTLQRLGSAVSNVDEDKFNALLERLNNVESEMGLDLAALDSAEGVNKAALSGFVEKMKKRDVTSKLMAVVKEEVPGIYQALIGERDAYMANSIATSSGSKIVAVMGLAHINGIERALIEQASFKAIQRNCP